MDIILWTDDDDNVVAFTPPGGGTTSDAIVQGLVPLDRPHFIKDHLDLPQDRDIRSWMLDEEGNITFRELPPQVPTQITSGNFARALYELEWYDDVQAAVNQAGGLAVILFRHAAIFERHNPLVQQIAAAIGKNEDDLDQLFILAATYD